MALDFAKEDIRVAEPKASALTASLAASSIRVSKPDAATTTVTATVSAASVGDSAVSKLPTPFTIQQVINAVIEAAVGEGLVAKPATGTRLALHVAEDDGSVDTDFPELDPNASITSVGVNQFVLCAGGLSKTMFLLNIPSDLVVLHACEASRDLPVLVVTCTLTGAAARAAAASSGGAPRSRSSFAVRLEHTSASTTSPAGGTVVSTPLAAPGS